MSYTSVTKLLSLSNCLYPQNLFKLTLDKHSIFFFKNLEHVHAQQALQNLLEDKPYIYIYIYEITYFPIDTYLMGYSHANYGCTQSHDKRISTSCSKINY